MREEFDAAIIGAGPVGLLTANYLGAQGLRVVILEALPDLIDYPRGVGMDDECLRAIQAAGLVEAALPHITHNQIMHFTSASGRRFASLLPKTDEFGWPRRNSFIQPLIDRVLASGLSRYPQVELRFGQRVSGIRQDDEGLTISCEDTHAIIRAQYAVAADGGASSIRKQLGIAFEGRTDSNRWIVVDIANDPLGTPDSFLNCRPSRPYVSIALPHGIRRFEFLLFDGEAKGDTVSPEMLERMLSSVLPDPRNIDLIRARVYTHNGRLAERFRAGRILLAGDAAHIMPVWQGQGYNSGVRDAFNLGWKLALVLKGRATDALLDSYESERRAHASAMISLSETAGRIFSPTNRLIAWLRDTLVHIAGAVPSVKRYFLEMRFKPMPRYVEGALLLPPDRTPSSPVGKMFIQPHVRHQGSIKRLDDAIGTGFAILSWGGDPRRWLGPIGKRMVQELDMHLVMAVPETQLDYEGDRLADEDLMIVGDSGERLKRWFGEHDTAVILLRPDRFVAFATLPQDLEKGMTEFAKAAALKI